jgi:CHAT domain
VSAISEGFLDIRIDVDRQKTKVVIAGDENQDFEAPHELTPERCEELQDIYQSSGGSEDYGLRLFRLTFRDGAETGYRRAKGRTQVANGIRQRARFRLSIDTNAPELHQLWWETLTDPDGRTPLGRSRKTALSRHLPVAGSREPADADRLRVLVVVSNPADLGEGRWRNYAKIEKEAEVDVIQGALATDRAELEVLGLPASPGNIRRRLGEGGFHVLHLVAHGGVVPNGQNQDELGFLLLEQIAQQASGTATNPVGEAHLGQMIQDLDELRLVVLASCNGATRSTAATFLGLAPRILFYGVPAVVAMQDSVEVDTTRTFIKHFYESLGNQSRGFVDIAVNDAREEIFNEHLDTGMDWGWPIPVVFIRGEGLVLRPQTTGLSLGATVPKSRPSGEPDVVTGTIVPMPRGMAKPDPSRWIEFQDAQQLLAYAWDQDFDEDEIRSLAYMVNLEYEDLRGSVNDAKVREVVRQCAKAGRLELLSEQISKQIRLRERRLMYDPAVRLLLTQRPA